MVRSFPSKSKKNITTIDKIRMYFDNIEKLRMFGLPLKIVSDNSSQVKESKST